MAFNHDRRGGAPGTPPEAPDARDAPGPDKAPIGSLRTLWPFVMRQKALFFAWLLALVASSSATLALPVAVRHIIDQGFSSGSNIDATFAMVLLVAVALALATAARFFFVSLLGERVVADLRNRLYGHLVGLDQAFFERSRSGELVSRLTADTELLRSVIGTTMSVALRSTVTVLGSVVMLMVTSPKLAVWALVGIPLLVLPLVLGGRRLQKISRQSQDRVADANALATESLGAIRTVQAHAREAWERERFADAVALSVATARRRIGVQALVTAVAISLIFGAIILVLWSGAHDVIRGDMTAGILGQFVLYALLGAGSVGALAEVWNELQRAAGGMGRIGELLGEHNGIAAPAQPASLPHPVRGALQLAGVRFHYPTRPDAPALEGFTPSEAAQILGSDVGEIEGLIAEAQREIDEDLATDVLIIEDEPVISADIEALVRELGHDVTAVATTHDEAVDAVARDRPGLVLADIQLADGSSGIDAVRDILKRIDVPVIFITAFPERLLTGERPEPTFLITKPFQPETVKAAISQALFFHPSRAKQAA